MDFNEIADRYGKKPERQRAFVIKSGIPEELTDLAMMEVYNDLSLGKMVFNTPAEFDQYILKVAHSKVIQIHIDAIKILQKGKVKKEWDSLSKLQKILLVLKGKA